MECQPSMHNLCHIQPTSHSKFWHIHTSLLTLLKKHLMLYSSPHFPPAATVQSKPTSPDLQATAPTSLRKHEQINPHRIFMGPGPVLDPFRECEMFWVKYGDSGIGTTGPFYVRGQNTGVIGSIIHHFLWEKWYDQLCLLYKLCAWNVTLEWRIDRRGEKHERQKCFD